MDRMLVMTVIGPDRPGLVDLLSTVIAEHQGNWLESRMSRLGGQFAGILRVAVAPEKQAALASALAHLAAKGLTVTVTADAAAPTSQGGRYNMLEIVGHDRPGIVREISRALARFSVNVEELESECVSAPMTGETLFKATARLYIPGSCNIAEVRRELEKIAADLIVEINLAELQPA